MDAYDWSTGVYATAVAMAKCMTTEELSRTAILLTSWAPLWAPWRPCGRWRRAVQEPSRRFEEQQKPGGGHFRSPAGLCDRFISARPRDPA